MKRTCLVWESGVEVESWLVSPDATRVVKQTCRCWVSAWSACFVYRSLDVSIAFYKDFIERHHHAALIIGAGRAFRVNHRVI